jgi:hypothetical protein
MVDIQNLLVALDNNENENIINLTNSKIMEYKNNCLQRLQLGREILKSYHQKLKEYRYCSDISCLNFGHYVRWISLKNPQKVYLTRGAILCGWKVVNDTINLILKGSNNRVFEIKFDEVEVFQKLSNQEKVILKVLEMIEST